MLFSRLLLPIDICVVCVWVEDFDLAEVIVSNKTGDETMAVCCVGRLIDISERVVSTAMSHVDTSVQLSDSRSVGDRKSPFLWRPRFCIR